MKIMNLLSHFLLIITIGLLCLLQVCTSCALPYWWIEEFSLPPSTLQSVRPKTTYRYRETLQVYDPYSFVHVKEYAEYSWFNHQEVEGNGITINKKDSTTVNPEKNPIIVTPKKTSTTVAPKKKASSKRTTTTKAPSTATGGIMVDNKGVVTPRPGIERNDKEREVLDKKLDDLSYSDGEGPCEKCNDVEILKTDASSQKPKHSNSFFDDWFGNELINETKPCKVSEADIHSLRSMIEKMFSYPRDHLAHAESKEKAREDIIKKFREFGLQVWSQNFSVPVSTKNEGSEDIKEGVNLVGVIPGTQRGKLSDGIVLVGAHYDTVSDSNGVDDNGSGLAVMMEIAKGLTKARCKFNNTLMFVAFDLEEDGAMGSNHFVDHYLIPEELNRARAHFQGAFILDGIMNFNSAPNTQELPIDFAESLPGLQYFVNNTGNKGDFLAMISRNQIDNHLTQQLMDAWQKLDDHNYKLYNLAVDMGEKIPPPQMIESRLNFLNSDHATFWYHNSSRYFPETLNAVLLTDTGPFRGQMKNCYHSKCDDLTVMNPEKLQFAKKTSDALTATLVELTQATAGGRYNSGSIALLMIQIALIYIIGKITVL